MLNSYKENRSAYDYAAILSHLLDGIANDTILPMLVKTDDHGTAPVFIEYEDGSESLAVMTDAEEIPSVGIGLRKLIQECQNNEDCDGILINRRRENAMFVPLNVLLSGIRAGYQIAIDDLKKKADQM